MYVQPCADTSGRKKYIRTTVIFDYLACDFAFIGYYYFVMYFTVEMTDPYTGYVDKNQLVGRS